jgi:hypothetical protein
MTASADSLPHDKHEAADVERLGPQQTYETYYEREEIDSLSQEHRDYLMKRHGTLDLDPVPAFGDADPYNWPSWKVCNSDSIRKCCS